MKFNRPFFVYGGGRYSPVNTREGEYPSALVHAVPNAMGKEFASEFIEWTAQEWRSFNRGGDGDHRRDVEAVGIESCGRFGQELQHKLLQCYEEAFDACGVEPFSSVWCEMNAIGYLHDDRFRWHTDHFQSSVCLRRETKGITFLYYAHQEPRRFTGGGLEFADGTIIEPENDLLLWINPYQRHQVLDVKLLEGSDPWRGGRWTLGGWLHRSESEVEKPTWHEAPGAPRQYNT